MFWKPRRKTEDFSREVQSHLDLETERLINEGMNPEDARTAARRAFGNVTAVEERFYESRHFRGPGDLMQDLRFALRSMGKYPLACAVAVISLAGGIGSTTATLTLRDTVFLKPPPLYQDPKQLSKVSVAAPDRPRSRPVPGTLYKMWAMDRELYSDIAAATPSRQSEFRTAERLETVSVTAVTPELFGMLGVSPALGRNFSQLDFQGEGPTPLMLSHRAWQRLFDGNSNVLGATLWIDDKSHTVIGVMPERFWFSSMEGGVWTPLDVRSLRADDVLEVVIRRHPHVAATNLAERLQRGTSDYASRLPEDQRRLRAQVADVKGTPIGSAIATGVVLLIEGCVLLTLLIACTNVAILMIAQWTAREHEIAIRASLGASRSRVVRLLLAESVLMAIIGGFLGILATLFMRGFLLRYGPGDVVLYDFAIAPGVLIKAAAITLLTGILAGIAPALYETRRLQTNPLRLIPSDRVRQRWRHALVVLEITVTVALLVVTSAMIDAYQHNNTTDLGFRPEPLLSVRVEGANGVRVAEILDHLNNLPGVVSAAAATAVPPLSRGRQQTVATDQAGSNRASAASASISSSFFATLQATIRDGRSFTNADMSPAARVTIINQTLARRLMPDRDPIGAYLWIGEAAYQIVGIASDYATNSMIRNPEPRFYLPLSHHAAGNTAIEFLVRSSGDPASMVSTVRREIRSLGKDHVVSAAFTLQAVIKIIGDEILSTTYLMAPLIATGLLLTAAGIYSILAFAITRRSKELAVRIAVGATRKDLLRLVTAHSMKLLVTGVLLGVGATFALTRAAQGAGGVFDSPGWQTFAIPVLIVIAIGALATWIPSRRALAISPVVLLRMD